MKICLAALTKMTETWLVRNAQFPTHTSKLCFRSFAHLSHTNITSPSTQIVYVLYTQIKYNRYNINASPKPYYNTPHTYHCIHSPYIFGRSPRIYASKVRFITADQSRSRLSSDTSSPCSSDMFNLARALCSPARKRCPRSGKFRDGSKGFHL